MRLPWAVFLLLVCIPAAAAAQPPAEAAAERPPQLQLGGYVQYDYLAPMSHQADAVDTFRFRRVRLMGTGALSKHVGWSVSVEATTTPILRDAFLTLKFVPAATVRIGQLVMPFGQEQFVFSSNTMGFTERIATEIVASRDAGVMVSNEQPFFGWLSYAVGVTNGTRQNVSDNNSAKDGIARLTATPSQVPGLNVSVNAVKGEQPDGMRTRTGADVSFERRRFHLAAEFDREQTGNGPRKEAAYAFGLWRLYSRTPHPGFHHLEFGVRLGHTKHMVRPGNQWDLAANYYVTPNVRFLSNVVLHRDRAEGDPRATFHARANFRF